MTRSILVEIARVVAQVCAFVGVVAGFWHILWIAGVGMLASGLVGVAVHSAGYVGLDGIRSLRRRKSKNPATPTHRARSRLGVSGAEWRFEIPQDRSNRGGK
jgi:hypothetical protein